MKRLSTALVCLAIALAPACGKKHEEDKGKGTTTEGGGGGEAAGGIKTDKGVDAAAKVVKIGALNDESGPAAIIGKPYANGKRLLAAVVNAGGVLPDGWKIELVERDHGYNPMNAKKEYDAIKDQVLFIGTSFGTPPTRPLIKPLSRDNLIAFPASLSSEMAENMYTPPLGPSYEIEAMRAMDWAVAHAGDAKSVNAGIIYQDDDYGKDGLTGFKKAAEKHGVTIVAEHGIQPTDKDFTAVIKDLQEKKANYVLLTVLPSASGPILGGAAATKYTPVWIGQTPSWVDAFFAHPNLPAAVFTNFHWVMGLPYWGEELPGMDVFLKAWADHGKDMGNPDFYTLASYVQGLIQMEILKRAIEAGDVTRTGYMKQLHTIDGWNAGGLTQPVSLKKVPFQTSTSTRVLVPDFEKKSWKLAEHGDYAEPKALGGGAE